MAANTARNLNQHYANLATSTRRLSSGLRINSAADDAAGLAIRELQRAECAALNQGARNVNDAISMLQVTDGALGIIDEKLIRLRELAEAASSCTYDSTQRLMIDYEFQAMCEEIDRIAISTDFNRIKLLDGYSLARIDLNTPIIYNSNTINVEIENNIRNIVYHHVPQGMYIGNKEIRPMLHWADWIFTLMEIQRQKSCKLLLLLILNIKCISDIGRLCF